MPREAYGKRLRLKGNESVQQVAISEKSVIMKEVSRIIALHWRQSGCGKMRTVNHDRRVVQTDGKPKIR